MDSENQTVEELIEEEISASVAAPVSSPISLKRISDSKQFILEVEDEESGEIETYPTCRGEISIRVIGGDELMEIFTAQFRQTATEAEFDKLKTSEKIFIMTLVFGVAKETGDPLFTVGELTKMYKGKNKARYTQFLQEAWDGVNSVNYWLDPKNPSSLRRMIRMLFG